METRTLLAGDLVAHWLANDLNATVGDGESIPAWTDNLGSAAAAAQGSPTLVQNALSGRSVVHFDAGDGMDGFRLPAANSPIAGAGDFSVAVVFRTDSSNLAAATGTWFEATGLVDSNRLGFTKDWGLSIDASGQINAGIGTGFLAPHYTALSSESNLNDGQLYLVTFTRSGGELSVYVNDGSANTLTGADAAPRDASIDITIGMLQDGKNGFSGDIAEVRLYDGQLDAGEVSALYGEVHSFYNNAAPSAQADTYNFTEDPLLGFHVVTAAQGVLVNDADPEGNAMQAVLVQGTTHGTVSLAEDGSFLYDPDKDFFGTDSFVYTAFDGQHSQETTVTLNVSNVYDAPTAHDDVYRLTPTETLTLPALVGVLANDDNPDQTGLTAVLATDVNQGSLTLNGDGSFSFDPQGQAGYVTFTYQIDDQTNLSSPATVTFIVNTAPVANADAWSVAEDTVLSKSAANGVLANDVDADGNVMHVTLVEGPMHGQLELNEDGSFSYTPDLDYSGPDQFTYFASDAEEDSQTVTALITVNAVNDPPVGLPDSYFRNVDQTFDISAAAGLLANDDDVDSANLSVSLATGPDHGTLTLNANGSLRYTPNAGFQGTDTFTYVISDGTDTSAPVEVNLLVGDPPVVISEIMAANTTGLETRLRADAGDTFRGEKDTPDWIELTNLTTADLDLGGFFLSDNPDEPLKWQFPAGTTVSAGGRLIVFADRMNVTDPALDENGYLHTNFQLSADGETLTISTPGGSLIQEVKYPKQRSDVAYGTVADGSFAYLTQATPGAPNGNETYAGIVGDTTISVSRGYYTDPFSVEITTGATDATIRYTLDGSKPTATNGIDYNGPINVTTTTVLRATASKAGYLDADVNSQTYIFGADVLAQDDTGLEGAVRWGHAGPDWAMDPVIVNNSDPELRPEVADLLRIPTVSLTVDVDEFFGSGGIYIRGENIEKPIGFEYFDPNAGDNGTQTSSTIQIVGGSSPQRWKSDKLSMRVRFTEDEGESELNYPVFGPNAALAFDTLVVDARLNNVWHYGGGSSPDAQRGRAQYMRDEYAADLQNAVGGTATHAQHVHVYINGLYWGMHILHERPDENFAATYLGGSPEQTNVIKHTANETVNGTNESFLELNRLLGTSGELSQEDYQAASELLDVDDFINYMLVNFYGGNRDWDHHNWYASQSTVDGRWRFHSWDAEKVLEGVNDNSTTINNRNAPTGMHRRLMTNPEYALRFADKVQEHFFHGGAMTPEAAAQLYLDRSDQIDLVMRVESARWGDNQIDSGRRIRYTRQHWVDNRNDLLENYFPRRTDIVLRQFGTLGWYTQGEDVSFSVNGVAQHGGYTESGSSLTMNAADGTIYFTTDGTDPRLVGGDVHPSAMAYTAAQPIVETTLISARLRMADGSWGPLSQARFSTAVPADASNLRITEVQYHPGDLTAQEEAAGIRDADEFEFIELLNVSNVPIDLNQVAFRQSVVNEQVEGISFEFSTSALQQLGPGERLVVVENVGAFQVRYGDQVPVAGQWTGGLNNAEERLTLYAGDQLLADFTYQDDWVASTDGDGPSLQVRDELAEMSQLGNAASWRASSVNGGTPGAADSGQVPGDSNGDGIFNSADLVLVFQAGKYEDNIPDNATWEEGDWNGDGDFTTSDLVLAFQAGTYVAAAQIRGVSLFANENAFTADTAKQRAALTDVVLAEDDWDEFGQF